MALSCNKTNGAATIPDKTPPDEITIAAGLDLLDKSAQIEEPLGAIRRIKSPFTSRWDGSGLMFNAAPPRMKKSKMLRFSKAWSRAT